MSVPAKSQSQRMNVRWYIVFVLLYWGSGLKGYSQCLSRQAIYDSIIVVERNQTLSVSENKEKIIRLKNLFDSCGYAKDSVYARLLHRLGGLAVRENNNIASSEAISYTLEAIQINRSGLPGASAPYLINSYYNLGVFYESLKTFPKAIIYYDSAIITDDRLKAGSFFALRAGYLRAMLFNTAGEYQKSIEECRRSLVNAEAQQNRSVEMSLLNEQAQSYLYLGNFQESLEALNRAEALADALDDPFEKAHALKTRARLAAATGNEEKAELLFQKTIATRFQTKRYFQIADDYIDFGTFYFEQNQYKKAKECYFKAIELAGVNQDKDQLAKAWHNLSAMELATGKDFTLAEQYLGKCLEQMGLQRKNVSDNIQLTALEPVYNKDLLIAVLKTRANFLLTLYKEKGDNRALQACLKTAMLTDSVLNVMRHQHTEEQSKLYWRNLTRDFFAIALEACYMADNMPYAFYFMEKSRAVLLYDQISERVAAGKLPLQEIRKEQDYKYRLIALQYQLERNIEAEATKVKLSALKDSLERYIRTLEVKYPEYYRLKYTHTIPDLKNFQGFLATNGEAFVHYFFNDTLLYALVIAPDHVKMIRRSIPEGDIGDYISYCANRQQLNNDYRSFITLSHRLYNHLFKPLSLDVERIIICQDNYLVPFEAFAVDETGENYLISYHTFSYAYSAASLLYNSVRTKAPASGNFAGFAPVTFARYLSVPDLKLSEIRLRELRNYYNTSSIFTRGEATKKNFISYLADYSIVSVFSHAVADTEQQEPVLYMQDSAISLSELQTIDHSATQLIMLNACQTNVGRNEIGEGIYSLARGFAGLGIPSVTSTLWKADEAAVYIISKKFHEYLTNGFSADKALQQAKLFYLKNGARKDTLPYYWANMVLIGSNDSITDINNTNNFDYFIMAALLATGGFLFFLIKRLIKN